jgi:hypothetical protein
MGDMLTMNSLGDGSTLSLDFTTGVLDSRLTFTRSTTATYINSSGYVTSAAINAPRFDYSPTNIGQPRGLLIEGQTTNYLKNSGPLNGTGWSPGGSVTTTLNYATGPDGLTSATRLQMFYSGSNGRVYQDSGFTTKPYTNSVWIKSNTGGNQTLNIWNTNGLGTALITATPTWQRFENVNTTGTSLAGYFYLENPSTNPAVVVDVLVWGAQLEAGSGASSYIPTGASGVTRAVDTAIIAAGTNFSSWYTGNTSGTFVTEWCRCSPTTTQRTVIATNDLPNQHLHQYIAATTSRLRLADNVPAFIETANASIDNSINKGAFSYSGSVQSLCLNGGTVVLGTLTFTTAPTWLSIGGPSTNGTSITDTAVVLNNAIRKIKYFPTRLSDAKIKEITT